MPQNGNIKEHYNLYYIFEEDKKAHPMPLQAVENIRKALAKAVRDGSGADPP